MTSGKTPVGILISGRGSNMAALIDAARADDFPARIAIVIANVADAPGLMHAKANGIATAVVDHRNFTAKKDFEDALTATLREHQVQTVCLAGFMRVLSPHFLTLWKERVLNIHPSLLPKYPGLDTHARALAAGDTEHGCTVHIVTPDVDAGPILAQSRVSILPNDTAETLATRVLQAEHRLYPTALRNFLQT